MSGPGVIPRQVPYAAVPMQDSSGLVTEPLQQIGHVVDEFGVLQGRAENAQRLQQTTLDATKQLDDLHLQFESDPDPATAASRFADAAAKIHDQAAGSLTDPESQAQFQHQFGLLTEVRRVEVASEAMHRQVAEAQASVVDGLDQYAKSAAAAKSPQERAIVAEMASSSLKNAVTSGVMNAKTAQHLGAKFSEDLAQYDARSLILADPAKGLKALKDGAFPDLEPNMRLTLQEHADAELRQREREARAEAAQARVEVGATLSDIQRDVTAGLPVDPSLLLPLKHIAASNPVLANRWETVNAGATMAAKLRGASPVEVSKTLNALEIAAAENPSAPTREALIATRRFATAQQDGLHNDPLTWAVRQGTIQVQPLALNGSDSPDAWKARITAADKAAAIYHRQPEYLTASEGGMLRDAVDHAGSADEKMAVAKTLIEGLGDRAASELQRLGAKSKTSGMEIFTHAASLSLAGKRDAARDALAGQTLMKGKDNLSPKLEDMSAAMGQVQSAFRMAPGMVSPLMSTAIAIYAKRASDRGLSGADASGKGADILDQAVQDAAGAGYDAQGNRYGGIVDFNGRKTAAPATIKADDFAPIIKGLTPHQLVQGSANGGAPVYGNGQKFEKSLGETWLLAVGDGRYMVSTTDPRGEPHLLQDSKTPGRPYVLDLHAVLPWMRGKAQP